MVKFIFEDNISTPTSQLLKSCYNGNNINFSHGAKAQKIFAKIDSLLNDDQSCTIIVFYDLPPNNRDVFVNYEILLDILLNDRRYERVCIIPILCIEYYALLLLSKYTLNLSNTNFVYKFLSTIDFSDKDVNDFINSSDYRKTSLEHVYKELLQEYTIKCKCRCMINKNSQNQNTVIRKDSIHGKFYLSNCDCDRKFCKIGCEATLSRKTETFYALLPCFDVIDDTHPMSLTLDKTGEKRSSVR